MKADIEQFRELFSQYLAGDIDADGKASLLAMIDRPEYQDELDALLRESYEQSNGDYPVEPQSTSIFIGRLKDKMNGTSAKLVDTGKAKNKPVLRWLRVAAAACLLLIAGGGIYRLVSSKNEKKNSVPDSSVAAAAGIMPGKNGAVLTLSNGQKIVLDSAGNGVLTSDARVKIIKKGDKIFYEGLAGETLYNTISTDKGRQWQLTLSDGTKVWLNAASSIRYPLSFNGNQREVEITGEIYFEVAHNAAKPFHVKLNDGAVVEVLGTSFNINSYSNEPYTTATLLQGKIKLTKAGKEKNMAPGQQLLLNGSGDMEINNNPDIDEVMAWKNGKFIFNGNNIKTVMRELERWYNITVQYDGEPTDDEFIGVISRDVELSKILTMLETSGSISFEVEDKKIIIVRKK